VYVDGGKHAIVVISQGKDGKYYRKIQVEEGYLLVGEPGGVPMSPRKMARALQ